jgi:hypothetical protein
MQMHEMTKYKIPGKVDRKGSRLRRSAIINLVVAFEDRNHRDFLVVREAGRPVVHLGI